MKQVTITLPDELEQAINQYREGLLNSPELDELIQRALILYLAQPEACSSGFDEDFDDTDDIIFPTRPKPEPIENPPALLGGASVAEAVIEDRR